MTGSTLTPRTDPRATVYKPAGRNKYRIEFLGPDGSKWRVAAFRDQRASQGLAAKLENDAARLRAGLPLEHLEITGPYLKVDLGPGRRLWEESMRLYLADLVRRGCPDEGRHVSDCEKQLTKIGKD